MGLVTTVMHAMAHCFMGAVDLVLGPVPDHYESAAVKMEAWR